MQKVKLQADYLYYVATYGTSAGASDFYAEKFLGKKLNASFSVRMPDTWTPFFDLSTPEKIAGFSKSTESEIKSIIEHLQQKDCGHFMDNSKSKMTTKIAYSLYESMRKTKVHGQYTNPNVKI